MSFPLILFSSLMAVKSLEKIVSIINRVYYLLVALLIISLNFIDIGFYPFVFKRLTADATGIATNGNDLANYILPIMFDFWYLFVIGWGGFYFFMKWEKNKLFPIPFWKKWKVLYYIPIIPVFILGARGGWQLKPITLIDASLGVPPENATLVLNTPFTFFTTLYAGSEPELDVMDSKKAEAIFSIEKIIKPRKRSRKTNVVVLIMESFAKEYLEEGYMPFLDSLKNEGLYFTNAMANGKRSIDAVPAILASIPDLQSSSFIYSSYASNTVNSLPSVLKAHGYKTCFFHGGRTGTMGFDKFASLVGIEKYYGAEDYLDQSQFDGTWGIYDEPFFQFMINELNEVQQPFFSTFFSLSSHHPYKIPNQYEEVFPKGTLPIHESIGYADFALKQFFEAAKKQSWFSNTLFVILADHTSISNSSYYNSSLGMFRIPLLFYSASDTTLSKINTAIAQQCDVFPSVLSYVGIEDKVKTFGRNLFQEDLSGGYVLNRSSGIYYLYDDEKVFATTMDQQKGYFNLNDSLKTVNLLDSINNMDSIMNQVKSRYQVYKDEFSRNQYFVAPVN